MKPTVDELKKKYPELWKESRVHDPIPKPSKEYKKYVEKKQNPPALDDEIDMAIADAFGQATTEDAFMYCDGCYSTGHHSKTNFNANGDTVISYTCSHCGNVTYN